jgi:hypothetical protein
MQCNCYIKFCNIISLSAHRLLLLISCLAYPSALEMEVICSSETSGFLRITRRYNPENLVVCSHPRDSLKSKYMDILYVFRLMYVVILCDAVTIYMIVHS